MDIDYYVDLPGGDNFEDVTELFVEGASREFISLRDE